MNICLRLVVCCLFIPWVLQLSGPLAADDWQRLRGPHGDGISREAFDLSAITLDSIKVRWSAEVGTGFSSVVVVDKRVVTVGNESDHDTIFCFDTDSGDLRWKYRYAAPLDDRDFEGGSTGTPAIDQGRVYFLARQGDLFCLELSSGKEVWRQQIVDLADVRVPGWGFSGTPVVFGDQLLLSAGEAGVSVDKNTGDLLWASADKEAGYASPVILNSGDNPVGVFPSGRSFTAVNLVSGKAIWQQRWLTTFGCNAADPILHDGKIFLCSGYNRGCALLAPKESNVEVLWKNKLMQNQLHTCIRIGESLFGIHGDMEGTGGADIEGGSDGPRLVCMDFNSGALRWTADGITPTAISAFGKTLVLLTASGDLVLAPADSSEFNAAISTHVLDGKCWVAPALSDGSVYCRDVGGALKRVSFR